MAEIEKKYSDYQESECEAFEKDAPQPMDDKLCPTCQIDPNFKLESNWWELEEAYLNRLYCEYHVRVYEKETAVLNKSLFSSEDAVKNVAAGRILVDLDKPLNNGTRTQVQNASYIKETYRDLRSAELGEAYLVAVPAFNFDQIPSNEDTDQDDDNDADTAVIDEIILNTDGLFRKLRQLRLTLKTYEIYYRSAQIVGEGFVIREEADETRRIDYENTAQNLKKFIDTLNDTMSNQGFAKLNRTGLFRKKRAEKIKIIFKDNDSPFDLKNIWALPDNGCGKYEKLKIKKSSDLRKAKMRPIYNFLQNLDSVINDITAKETKPWLEFTTDNFFPEYIVDYGDIDSIDDSRAGLECLLQDQLGIGNGQIIDSLAKEIVSAFDGYEQEMAKEVCRAIKEGNPTPSPTELAEQRAARENRPIEERARAMNARYEKEYKNQFLKFVKGLVEKRNEQLPEDSPPNLIPSKINLQNVFRETNKAGITIPAFTPKEYKVRRSTDSNAGKYPAVTLTNLEQLEGTAKDYANTKFNALEDNKGLRNQIQNSPHFQEAVDARREIIKSPENTFIQGFKDAVESRGELSVLDVISAFGICGMTKTAGKALECLAGGVSFDRFLGILIDKTFDFMEVNTLSLFMNGLPADFRQELNEEIERQFGNISLSDLFELKKAENPNQKIKDFSTSRTKVDKVFEIYKTEKEYDDLSQSEKDVLFDWFGREAERYYIGRLGFYSEVPSVDLDVGLEDFQALPEEGKNRFKKDLKLARRLVGLNFPLATSIDRIRSALDTAIVLGDEPEDLDQYSQVMNSFEETSLGVKVDAVFDVVIDFAIDFTLDYFGLDDLFARLQNYPIVDFVAGLIDKYLGSCETAPVIYPPPGDFLKGLSVDICDPTISLALPKISIPSISLRYKLEAQFGEIFREAIIKLATEIVTKILKKLLFNLEGSLCNLLEAAGGFSADALKNRFDDLTNSFYDALNEAFCNDGENSETAESRAKELADALFSPLLFDAGMDYEGSGAKVANVISSVASTEEFLEAMVAREGEEDDQFGRRIANAVNALTPEMAVLLGDPNQVAYFFRNLGSYLTPEDRDRIRDLLDAGIPNLPLSPALCLTNDQLNDWNDFRNQLLQEQGLTPEQAADRVSILNDQTEKALEDIFDIVGDLETDGPFLGSLANEALKDVCNPNNVINVESQSEFATNLENEVTEAFFDNIQRSLATGFFSEGGILSEALKDKEDRIEMRRGFFKRFNGNYTNSQSERDNKYGKKGRFGKFLMDLRTEDGEAIGVYPETVAIKQRKQIIDGDAQQFSFSSEGKNRTEYTYSDTSDDFEYQLSIESKNSIGDRRSFNYQLQVDEYSFESGLFDKEDNEKIVQFETPVPVLDSEVSFFRSQGFQITSNQNRDIRKELFTKIIQNKVAVSNNFASNLYEQMYESINKNLSNALLTDYRQSDEIPVGYKFGYVSDDLTKDSFKYTPSENEGELGTFASSRIIPLDPTIYGGSFKRPPYYVEPRQFFGWVELGTKAFGTSDGCEPKRPPLFDMQDIKDRVKMLNTSLRQDPRMTKPADCVNEKPFHLLIDKKNKSKLDGVVRTTIRSYLGEYFIKGYGLFSNLQIRPDNFDQSMMLYLVNKMKSEMMEIGTQLSSRNVRIVRERYWYAFLEQSVEAYQRMIDVDGITAPEPVLEALNKIQIGIDKYRPVTKKTRQKMIKSDLVPTTGDSNIRKPGRDYDPVEVASQSNVDFTLQSVAFRLSSSEERDDFFNGTIFRDIQKRDIRFATLKKLNFFKKIYFIKVFEKEAILIMSELVREELSRLALNVVDGISDKPYYYDLHRSFFGMKSFFPKTTSRVGSNDFYSDKQRGVVNTGLIPEVKSNNAETPGEEGELIIESYVRLEERGDAPQFIRGRQGKYTGFVSPRNMSEFINDNLSLMEDSYLSDFFGDLSFTYEGSIKTLFDKGFANEESIRRLIELNKNRGAIIGTVIKNAFYDYVSSQDFEDFTVTYDELFILEGEDPIPTGTIGSTGVKYGMRLSVVLPSGLASQVQRTGDLLGRSLNERSYFFDDGGVVIPLVTSEIDVKDTKVENFDPFNGTEPYDLECLINKMVSDVEFQVIMDKVFNFKQASSMLAIYCIETLPAAIGRDPSEREEVSEDPDVDDWDRVVNKFGKNFLRREFKSIYLINHVDGQSYDDDDDSISTRRIRVSNPLDSFSLPSVRLPWWLKRRARLNIYDANGQECADPKKDLQ